MIKDDSNYFNIIHVSGSTAVNTGSGSGEANGGSGGSEAANVPAVGDTYLGCYVLAVDDAEDHAEVLVVAPADITGTFYGSGAGAAPGSDGDHRKGVM